METREVNRTNSTIENLFVKMIHYRTVAIKVWIIPWQRVI